MYFPDRTTWIEISKKNLLANAEYLRSLLSPKTQFLAVVKANAYGHGLKEVTSILQGKVDFWGVHSLEEAYRVREVDEETPILIMGYIPPKLFQEPFPKNVHILVSTKEVFQAIHTHQRHLPIHLKVETGTHRQGFTIEELPSILARVKDNTFKVVGLAMHFANIEDTTDHSFAFQQHRWFLSIRKQCEDAGLTLPYLHAACSAALLLFPETHGTLVRAGISLYGHWPSKETHLSWLIKHGRQSPPLQPVLTWKTVVGQVKTVPEGKTVGYGCTWKALRKTRLAVLPVGYADGYDRLLSNRAYVLIKGKRAPVVGRVCMNITMADVTDIPDVRVGDEVVLIGRSGEEAVTAEQLAGWSHTIQYEILARLSPTIFRVIV